MNFLSILTIEDNNELLEWLRKEGFSIGEIDKVLFPTCKREGYIKKLSNGDYGEDRYISITINEDETTGMICLDRGDYKESTFTTFNNMYQFIDGYRELIEERLD